MNEVWLPIAQGYLVSDHGRVRTEKGRVLGQWPNSDGYQLVRLSNPRRMERVHRLVALAFVHKPDGCDVVNHLDSDRANNKAKNLEWCTQAMNLQHAEKLGRMQRDYWSGKRSPNAFLSVEQVRRMRQWYADGGVSYQELALSFGVSKRCVGRVISREAYQDVQ